MPTYTFDELQSAIQFVYLSFDFLSIKYKNKVVNPYELFQENRIKNLKHFYSSEKKQALQANSREYEYYPGEPAMPQLL